MPRLGELLVAARLLDPEQVERALRAQVVWGGRFGTNLIELGLLDLEAISRALGRQHGMPAALARHFEKADGELQERLAAEVAMQWSVVPLLHVGPRKQQIAVAALGPLPAEARAALAADLLCEPNAIVVSVAAEMRLRYHLERSYGIKRPARYLRSKGRQSATPFPQFDNVPVPVDSDVEVAVPIAVDETKHPTGRATAGAATDAEAIARDAATDAEIGAPAANVTTAEAVADTLVAMPGVADVPPSAADPADALAALTDRSASTEAAGTSDARGAPPDRSALLAEAARAAALAATISLPDDLAVPPAAAGAPIRARREEDIAALARLIDDAIAQATSVTPAPTGRDRRTYVRTLADREPAEAAASAESPQARWTRSSPSLPHARAPAPTSAPTQPLGRVVIKRIVATQPAPADAAALAAAGKPTPSTFAEATRAIRRGGDRERVAELVIDTLQRFVPAAQAAVLLFVRGDVAISWKSFSRVCSTAADIAVPLDEPGLVPRVIKRNTVARAGVSDLGPIDEALLRSMSADVPVGPDGSVTRGGELRGDLVVVPIAIADTVVGLIATATEPDAPVEGVESVAAAAAAAVARLIRDASR